MTLRIHRFLSQGAGAESPDLEEATVLFNVGDTVEAVVRRLTAENRVLGDALCGGGEPFLQPGILVVLNNRIINRNEYATVPLEEGDEVAFLPMLDGG